MVDVSSSRIRIDWLDLALQRIFGDSDLASISKGDQLENADQGGGGLFATIKESLEINEESFDKKKAGSTSNANYQTKNL